MKKYLFHALLLLGGAALGSCSEQLETDVFNFSENTVRFTAEGGTQHLVIDVKCDCTLSCDADWIDYTPQYIEAGRSELTIEAAENPMFEARETTILIANEELNLSRTITVKQTGGAFIICSPDRITAPFTGGAFSIDLETNIPLGTDIPWAVSCNADWLTVVPERDNIRINISIWYDTGTRKTEIIVSNAEYNVTKKIAVEQTNLPEEENQAIIYTTSDNKAIYINQANDYAQFGAYLFKHDYDSNTRTGMLVFDRAVTKIGNKAFYECSSLTSVTIPDSVTTIEQSAFEGCSSLTNITIPDGVTTIGDAAFYNCNNLTSITIPDGVTTIGDAAFYYCSSLTSIMIPNSVTTIGEYAFKSCNKLTSVTIGSGVTSIGGSAFSSCSSLTSIYCKPQIPPSLEYGYYSSWPFDNISSAARIYVPTQSVAAYKSASGWSRYASMIIGYNF